MPKQGSRSVDAYDSALALLTRREHSKRELQAKLERRGFALTETTAVIEKLQTQNYQSDNRFAENLVRRRISDGYGPQRIVAELKVHGLSSSQIRTLIAAQEPDWLAIAVSQLKRRSGSKPPDSHKQAQFLLRRGFDRDVISQALRHPLC